MRFYARKYHVSPIVGSDVVSRYWTRILRIVRPAYHVRCRCDSLDDVTGETQRTADGANAHLEYGSAQVIFSLWFAASVASDTLQEWRSVRMLGTYLRDNPRHLGNGPAASLWSSLSRHGTRSANCLRRCYTAGSVSPLVSGRSTLFCGRV